MNTGPWATVSAVGQGVALDSLERFAEELHRWNRSIRLVGPRELDGVRGQIEDALLPFLHLPPTGPILDIGCGAGLPSVPLALCYPELEVVGLEPRQKRVTFVRHVIRLLCPGRIEVVALRSDVARTKRPDLLGRFATVTARAVTDVPGLLTEAKAFLVEGGRVVLPRGGGAIPCPDGWQQTDRLEYAPPPGFGPRAVVSFTAQEGHDV